MDRVEAALAGTTPLSELSAEEAVAFHAEVDARIQERLRSINLGAVLNASGIATVALSDSGELIQHRPDGSSGPLTTP